MSYDQRHGSPFDRGGADFWYGRGYTPHFYKGDTYSSDRVNMADMTKDEIAAYRAGYNEAENSGDRKDWGDDG